MKQPADVGLLSAGALRRQFDRAFSELRSTGIVQSEDLLAVKVGGDDYALRLNEISGVFKDKPITTLPASAPELAGLAGLRGALVPVFDLACLIGYAPSRSRRWLVTVSGPSAIAFAFESLGGHLRVSAEAIAEAPQSTAGRSWMREAVVTDGSPRALIQIPALVADIRLRVGGTRKRSES